MTDTEIIKALKWLIANFPKIENPKDDSDKLINCINLYCQNAVDELNRQKAELNQYAEEQHELMIEKDKLFDIAEKQKAEIER